jgi:hypothetical protein
MGLKSWWTRRKIANRRRQRMVLDMMLAVMLPTVEQTAGISVGSDAADPLKPWW